MNEPIEPSNHPTTQDENIQIVTEELEAVPPPPVPPYVTLWMGCLTVALWSPVGTCVRMLCSVVALRFQFFLPCDTLVLPNVLGTFLLGTLIGMDVRTIVPAAFAGLGSGYCGAFTTFSSWVISAASAEGAVAAHSLSSDPYARPNAGVMQTMASLCFPFVAFAIGRDVGKSIRKILNKRESLTERVRYHTDVVLGYIVPVVFDIVLLLSAGIAGWDRMVHPSAPNVTGEAIVVACLLGPVGGVLRYILVARINPFNFPLGTFCANVGAFVLVSALYPCSRTEAACRWVSVGIGGCLSSVSTFVADVYRLRETVDWDGKGTIVPWRSYVYGMATTGVGLFCASLAFVYA